MCFRESDCHSCHSFPLQIQGSILNDEDLIRIDADRIVFVSESDLQPGGTLQSMLDRRTDGTVDILVHPQVHLPATCTDEIATQLRILLSREVEP